jgi:transcriptional regulator with XRE-family HTH domain
MKRFSRLEVVELLRRACAKAGSQRAWARQHGVSVAYVSDVLRGRRDPGKSILAEIGKFGLLKSVTYSVEYVEGPGSRR